MLIDGSDGEHSTGTATIMIMGDKCRYSFCAVKTSRKLAPDGPEKVASAVTKWGLD